MNGIPPEALISAIALMTEARNAIDRIDPISSPNPEGLSARLSFGIGALRGHLIANMPASIPLRDAA